MVNPLSTWILITFLLIDLVTCDIAWTGNVATSCDFINDDLSNARTSSEDCFRKCNVTTGCTHYTWTIWNGGTCWMKKGLVYKDDAFATTDPSMICGVMKDVPYIDVVNDLSPAVATTNAHNDGRGQPTSCVVHFAALVSQFSIILLHYY